MNKQSVHTGSLEIDGVSIPISLYKTVDLLELPGQLFHYGCNGKIRQLQYCEQHGKDVDEVVTYSGYVVGDTIVPLGPEIRDKLLDRKAPFVVESSHKLSELASLLVSGLVPIEVMEVAPTQANQAPSRVKHDALFTLFERMRVKRVFLLCSLGIAGMKRYAILLPNDADGFGGQLLVLAYEEEIRDHVSYEAEVDVAFGKHVDQFIGATSRIDFPALSQRTYRRRISAFISNLLSVHVTDKPKRKPRKGVKKQLTGRAKSNA